MTTIRRSRLAGLLVPASLLITACESRRTITSADDLGVPSLAASASVSSGPVWTELFPTGTPPAPRYSAGQAYDAATDRLILFSGEDGTGLPRPTDVWVLTDATGTGGTPSWMELFPTGGPPLGREAQTVVYTPVSNRIIVFGGCAANCSPALSDVWVLSNANGIGGTPTWTQLFPSGPFGRDAHAAVYDPGNNRMIVFGGSLAFFGTDQNDVRVLTNADGTGGAPAWIQLAPSGTPPAARQSSGAAYDQVNNRLIVFGGLSAPSPTTITVHNDVWVLTNANGLGGTPTWLQLTPAGALPAARAAHSTHYDPTTNRLIVFGGGNGDGSAIFDDVWVLTNANGFGGTPTWTQQSPGGTPPPARGSQSSGYAVGSNALVVAMGRNDAVGPFFNDVWVLTNANGIIPPPPPPDGDNDDNGDEDEDDDDFDDDGRRDDEDDDDDDDGQKDDLDGDDDNDGVKDDKDADDDNDGIEDDFDSEVTHEEQKSDVVDLGSGAEAQYVLTARPNTISVTAVLADGQDLVMEILDPVGTVIAGTLRTVGRAVVTLPGLAPGDYTVRVRNIGATRAASQVKLIRSSPW